MVNICVKLFQTPAIYGKVMAETHKLGQTDGHEMATALCRNLGMGEGL